MIKSIWLIQDYIVKVYFSLFESRKKEHLTRLPKLKALSSLFENLFWIFSFKDQFLCCFGKIEKMLAVDSIHY